MFYQFNTLQTACKNQQSLDSPAHMNEYVTWYLLLVYGLYCHSIIEMVTLLNMTYRIQQQKKKFK